MSKCPLEFINEDPRAFDSCIVTNQDYVLCHWQDQILLSWLLSSISEEVVAQGISCSMSFELWFMLEKFFAS